MKKHTCTILHLCNNQGCSRFYIANILRKARAIKGNVRKNNITQQDKTRRSYYVKDLNIEILVDEYDDYDERILEIDEKYNKLYNQIA